MSDHFEKPKDWGVAPQSNWVSGTPIGQSEVRMPTLGDPGSHENASAKVSFGDDEDKGNDTPSLYQGRSVAQCPPGMSKGDAGICIADPNSKAKPESRMKALRGQWDRREEEREEGGKRTGADPSFKRERPAPPKGDPQIDRIRKLGYKGR